MPASPSLPTPCAVLQELHCELPPVTVAALRYYPRLEAVDRYVVGNLQRRIARADVAARIGFNPAAFSRYFQVKSAITFVRYVTTVRAAYGKAVLRRRQVAMPELAWLCGFATERTLRRAFLQVYGLPPARIREHLAPRRDEYLPAQALLATKRPHEATECPPDPAQRRYSSGQ